MAKPYVPIFYDWLEVTAELEDDEKGRLIDAIVMYASGQDYKQRLIGAERVLFPAYKASMERANEKSKKRAAAGSKGGQKAASQRRPQEAQEENPFGDYDDSGIPDTLEAYCARNLAHMSPGNYQELEHYRPDLSEEMIRHAIDDACGHSARSWAYVRKILNEYIRKGYKSLGDVLVSEQKNDSGKQSQDERPDNPLDRTKFY